MLERMDDFFTARINGYDEHMMNFRLQRKRSEEELYDHKG